MSNKQEREEIHAIFRRKLSQHNFSGELIFKEWWFEFTIRHGNVSTPDYVVPFVNLENAIAVVEEAIQNTIFTIKGNKEE